MTSLKWILSFAVILFGLSEVAEGQQRHDRRQMRQQGRIQQGQRSGQLTPAEAAKLRSGQRHVGRLERRAEGDGTVTDQEKFRLEKAQDRQNRRIYKDKHDGQIRADAPAPVQPPVAESPAQ